MNCPINLSQYGNYYDNKVSPKQNPGINYLSMNFTNIFKYLKDSYLF